MVILRLTNRPVLSHPTPYRDLDISSLPTEILDPPTLDPKEIENDKSQSTPHPILPLLPAGSALRTHLYPLSSALPEEYLPHPPSLLPEIKDFRGYAAEVLSCSATLVQVILLLRVAVSSNFVFDSGTNAFFGPAFEASSVKSVANKPSIPTQTTTPIVPYPSRPSPAPSLHSSSRSSSVFSLDTSAQRRPPLSSYRSTMRARTSGSWRMPSLLGRCGSDLPGPRYRAG